MGIKIFGQPATLQETFTLLLEYAEQSPLTLVMDEFQGIAKVNPPFFSQLQRLWYCIYGGIPNTIEWG